MTTSPSRPTGAPPGPSAWANDRTSVARSLPRHSRFRRRMTESETSTRESSASGSRSAESRRWPRFARRRAIAGARRPRVVIATVACRGARRRRIESLALVSSDDLLHQRMSDDVALGEADEADPRDVAQHLLRLAQPGRLAGRQIHLRDVARDHRLRAVAQAGEEHLHLLGRRVLRFVEDDERVV